MIEVNNVVKDYDKGRKDQKAERDNDNSLRSPFRGLAGVSFSVPPGELFGLIGPDGAGKTTLFRILTTLILADSGEATVAGLDVVKDYKEIRKRVGYMPGRFSLYQDLTVEENLNFFATLFHTTLEENYDLVKDIYVQIEPFKKRKAGKLSGGMKQKLALCCALIHRPEVLFLDEPTTGVDPVSRVEFWYMLDNLKAQGITIMVSTPYMDEASRCDRIALMRSGITLTIDTPQHICDSFQKPLFAVRAAHMYPLLQDLRSYEGTWSCYAFGDSNHLTLKPEYSDLGPLKKYLVEKGYMDASIISIKPGIEDCFMDLAKEDV